MYFKEFLIKEIKDNGSFQLSRKDLNNYTFSLFGHSRNKEIKVEKKRSWRSDNEVNNLLSNVSAQLKLKLTDKKFIKQNLYLINDGDYEHNTQDGFIDYVPGLGNQLHNSLINTGNLVGYVNKKHEDTNYTIIVSSRFGDDFLKHLIASSDGFLEVPNSGDAGKNGMAEWLLVFLWKVKLKHAYRLGLPKEYVSKREKIVSFRGNLDMNDAVVNPDFIPPYSCTYREHSYDNSITRLITNTFRLVRNKVLFQDCHKLRQDFDTSTEGKRLSNNELINFKPLKNPYYSDYNKVAELSQRIIKKEMADFSSDRDDFSAFFFDMSMLFEYFIRKMFVRKGYVLVEKNKDKYFIPSGGVYNNGNRNLYPDIIIKNDDSSLMIYDVKYKRYDFTYGVSREDLFQMNTYVGQLLNKNIVKKCGFIFPIEENYSELYQANLQQELNIAGVTIAFEILFFIVPKEGQDKYTEKFNTNIDNFQYN